MSAPKDDFEAVRTVVDAVKDFKPEEQQRIFRWAAEKLGLSQPVAPPAYNPPPASQPPGAAPTAPPPQSPAGGGAVADIKTFMAQKKPRNDVQFAAATAYFYRFEAPQAERKEVINGDDLQDAARKAGRDRFGNPRKTLQNAHQLGMLDKGTEAATFTINSVGENLVAMTLPDGKPNTRPVKKARKKAAKQAPAKKATKKSAKA
jgi:hypothetical protein